MTKLCVEHLVLLFWSTLYTSVSVDFIEQHLLVTYYSLLYQ